MPRDPYFIGSGQAGLGTGGCVLKLHRWVLEAASVENQGLFCSPVLP